MKLEPESLREMAKAGKNHEGSVRRLWKAIEWETPSGPDQLPAGVVAEKFWTSLRWPEDRLRSLRPAPEARALRAAVPDSSSEPAMRRAVPERVTSVMDVLPCRAARDCRSNCEAWVLEE